MPALQIDRLATGLIGPISVDVAAGECLALMGPSGAGKSLFLRAIVDLDPSTGNVTLGAQARHEMATSDWRKLMAELGLAGALEWDVARLSSGERQRLAIARALCRRPQALLLDEPTASLDDHATGLVEGLMEECCREGMALLVVTHNRQQARRIAKRLLRMSDGKIDQLSENVP